MAVVRGLLRWHPLAPFRTDLCRPKPFFMSASPGLKRRLGLLSLVVSVVLVLTKFYAYRLTHS